MRLQVRPTFFKVRLALQRFEFLHTWLFSISIDSDFTHEAGL